MQIVPTVVVVTPLKVTLVEGLEQFAFELSNTNDGPLLVIVTLTALGGAVCKVTPSMVWVSNPTVTLLMFIMGALT
jgi:hypothetical protein